MNDISESRLESNWVFLLLCNLILGLEDDRACSDVCLVLNMTPAALLKWHHQQQTVKF